MLVVVQLPSARNTCWTESHRIGLRWTWDLGPGYEPDWTGPGRTRDKLWRTWTQWDAPTLSVLEEAGLDTSALPRLTDVGGLRASAHGQALKRWPELDGVSVRLGVGDGAAACLGSG